LSEKRHPSVNQPEVLTGDVPPDVEKGGAALLALSS
jgi:hypothetical protein